MYGVWIKIIFQVTTQGKAERWRNTGVGYKVTHTWLSTGCRQCWADSPENRLQTSYRGHLNMCVRKLRLTTLATGIPAQNSFFPKGISEFCILGIIWQILIGRVETKWKRQWHPTPVLLPRKSHGWWSLVGCSPWGHWESDRTEQLHFHFSLSCIGEGNGTPVFLPGESQGRGSLVGCRLRGRTESDTTEAT